MSSRWSLPLKVPKVGSGWHKKSAFLPVNLRAKLCVKWPHKPCGLWLHMKSPLSMRGNGISSASRLIGQIRAACLTQKVNHPWVKPLILCASGKVLVSIKGSIKGRGFIHND